MDADRRNKRIFWAVVVILILLVALTTVYFCVRLGVFSPAENKEYIDLTPTGGSDDPSGGIGGGDDGTGPGGSGATTSTDPSETESTEPTFVAMPGFMIWDDEKVWKTYNEVEIFKVRYEGGEPVITAEGSEPVITVESANGEKVIAPGTENVYTFRLKNTGNVAMNYSIHLEAYYSDNVEHIPVEARMKGYYGRYMVGSKDAYAPVMDMNGVKEHATLDPGNYAIYNLEWRWPFESGDDAYDTYLGNLATEEDVTLTIVIRTFATAVDGSDIPETGDRTDVTGLLILGLCALVGIVVVILLLVKPKRNEEENAETGDPNTEESGEEETHEGS